MSTPLGLEHTGDVARALAAAFADDPVLGWLTPPRRRPERLHRFFAVEAGAIALEHGRSVGVPDPSGAGLLGAALVLPPGHWRAPLGRQVRHARPFVGAFGPRLPRALGVQLALERRHPRGPHLYLAFVGVVPAAQGAGVGTAMLAPLLDRCDREGLPAYLEASNPRCARLYRRLGFRTAETVRPRGGPPVELMTRPPTHRPVGAR